MHQLPLARIKKVMKADPEVKMISAEAPILFAKGCDIFITELTMRAWIHAEENKRRTLQRSDIASALAKSDMFDFLIDIVPREEASSHAKRASNQAAAAAAQPTAAQAQIPGVGAPNHAGQHPMAPGDYTLGGPHMPGEPDYRQPQTMYPGQVPPGAPGAYGQPQAQMYNVDDMYSYGTMPPQQVFCLSSPYHPTNAKTNSPSRAPRGLTCSKWRERPNNNNNNWWAITLRRRRRRRQLGRLSIPAASRPRTNPLFRNRTFFPGKILLPDCNLFPSRIPIPKRTLFLSRILFPNSRWRQQQQLRRRRSKLQRETWTASWATPVAQRVHRRGRGS